MCAPINQTKLEFRHPAHQADTKGAASKTDAFLMYVQRLAEQIQYLHLGEASSRNVKYSHIHQIDKCMAGYIAVKKINT
jgi:hypothetical protein